MWTFPYVEPVLTERPLERWKKARLTSDPHVMFMRSSVIMSTVQHRGDSLLFLSLSLPPFSRIYLKESAHRGTLLWPVCQGHEGLYKCALYTVHEWKYCMTFVDLDCSIVNYSGEVWSYLMHIVTISTELHCFVFPGGHVRSCFHLIG